MKLQMRRYKTLIPTLKLLIASGPLTTRDIADTLKIPSDAVRDALRSREKSGEAGVYKNKPAKYRGAGHCDTWAVDKRAAQEFIDGVMDQLGETPKKRTYKKRCVTVAPVATIPLPARTAALDKKLAGVPRLTKWLPCSPYADYDFTAMAKLRQKLLTQPKEKT